MFKAPKKFQILDADLTVTQMKSLESYLRNTEFDMMRPKNAKPVRGHRLPKIDKEFSNILKFRLIIDTTGTLLTQPIELKVYRNICLRMVINIYRLT